MRMIWDFINSFLTGMDQSARWLVFKITGAYLPPNCYWCRTGYIVACVLIAGLILGFVVRPRSSK